MKNFEQTSNHTILRLFRKFECSSTRYYFVLFCVILAFLFGIMMKENQATVKYTQRQAHEQQYQQQKRKGSYVAF